MVPDFRRDDVWTPAFAGVTPQGTFYEAIKICTLQFSFFHSIWHFFKALN